MEFRWNLPRVQFRQEAQLQFWGLACFMNNLVNPAFPVALTNTDTSDESPFNSHVFMEMEILLDESGNTSGASVGAANFTNCYTTIYY